MPPGSTSPPFDQFLATAEAVAQARPEADLEMAREVFQGVATLLHDGLALDGLDERDAGAAVAGLCLDLVAEVPAPRCAHVPRPRWRILAICTTQKVCPRPTSSRQRSFSSEPRTSEMPSGAARVTTTAGSVLDGPARVPVHRAGPVRLTGVTSH
jgi:hypothetical protein